ARTYRFLCQAPPPPGAATPTAPPLATSCPTLVAGENTITTSGTTRTFQLVLPTMPVAGEHYPVIFMWYWLGGSSNGFISKGEVQAAVDDQRFIAVVPDDVGADVFGTSFNTHWPFDITQTDARMQQEFTFFDDMLSCVEQQFSVNTSCVSTVGVSAGALFTDQLAQARSTTLASFISLSGGVGDTIIKPWNGAAHKLPGVVLWGGDGPPAMDGVKDILGCLGVGMDFSVASHTLEQDLTRDGHFFVECIHNCGHVEPPVTAPPGESAYAGIWEFAFQHPYWLAPGDSPYKTTGLPASLPAWCGIGAGGATPRSGGGCPAAENPCAF
ncbi:MAG: hypothetical protein ACM31C_19385, partial [Acidobacteriota bacterium]